MYASTRITSVWTLGRVHLTVFLLGVFVGLVSPSTALGAEERPRVRVVRTETPPEIDGRLDDEVWKTAALVDDLTQVVPVQGAKPSQRTEFRILTTDKALYFGIRAHDTNVEKIDADLMSRDAFLNYNDRVQVVIDPFHDRQNGYSFEVNPAGARRDVLLEGKSFAMNWDGIWFAEASIDANGWSAEMMIPYQSINYDPESDTWGLNLARGIVRNNEEARWADPHPERYPADLGNAGILEGMLGAGQGLGLEIVASLTSRYIDDPQFNLSESQTDPSGDIFFKLLPSLTTTLTANTNFGETEVDVRRLNFTRFAISFPEKREFFLQDALIFEFGELQNNFLGTPENGKPFFSRRIGIVQPDPAVDFFVPVTILAGGKVTGRVGGYKMGFLNTLVDKYENVSRQNLTVGRVAANVLAESTVGAIFTRGDPDGLVDNSVVGVDFQYRNTNFSGNNALTGTAWVQHSFTSGVDRDQFAYGAKLTYPNDIVNWSIAYKELAENFNPELGFVNRPGIRRYDAAFRYRFRRFGFIRSFLLQAEGDLITDRSNLVESGRIRLTPIKIETSIGAVLEMSYQHTFERPFADFELPGNALVEAGAYHYEEAALLIRGSRNWPLTGDFIIGGGEYYGGTRLLVMPTIEWRPSKHWLFGVNYQMSLIRLPTGESLTHVVVARAAIFFTPNISWTNLIQYDNVSNSMGINSRLRWIIQDSREIFVVLNQGIDNLDGEVTRGRTEPIIKVGWAFRF
ncbi:carbohydrate binding family 9 domain-containing protein [Myxococcota bacterium]|nr:carbohydrate binding family 9 domain-containing protein [Myxococcota bacterium]